jgi:hypothetical protein
MQMPCPLSEAFKFRRKDSAVAKLKIAADFTKTQSRAPDINLF